MSLLKQCSSLYNTVGGQEQTLEAMHGVMMGVSIKHVTRELAWSCTFVYQEHPLGSLASVTAVNSELPPLVRPYSRQVMCTVARLKRTHDMYSISLVLSVCV